MSDIVQVFWAMIIGFFGCCLCLLVYYQCADDDEREKMGLGPRNRGDKE